MGKRGPTATMRSTRNAALSYSRWESEGQPQLTGQGARGAPGYSRWESEGQPQRARRSMHVDNRYSRWESEGQPQRKPWPARPARVIADGKARANRNYLGSNAITVGVIADGKARANRNYRRAHGQIPFGYSRWESEGQPQLAGTRPMSTPGYSRWESEGQPQLRKSW